MTTGLDLVAMQVRHAAAESLSLTQQDIRRQGHAIECRLYAERPSKNFLPSPGVLTRWRFPPASAQVRIDTGVREGDRITHYYDPMIAKVVVRGKDRNDAISTMLSTLCAMNIEGVETNLAFLRSALAHEAFRSGRVRTSFVDAHLAQLLRVPA